MYDYPEDFFGGTDWLIKASGTWIPKSSDSLFIKWFYTFYNVSVIFYANIFWTGFETYILKETMYSVPMLLKHLGMMVSLYAGNLKVSNLLLRHKRITKLTKLLNDDRFKYESYRSYKPAKIFRESMSQSKIVGLLFVGVSFGVGTAGFLGTFPNITEIEEGKSCGLDYMPQFAYVPFKANTRDTCRLAVFLQSLQLLIYGAQIGRHEMIFSSLMNCAKAHFYILGGAFETLRERCLVRLGLQEEIETLRDQDINGLEEEMFKEVRKCTIHLETILEICVEIEDIFTYITLYQSIASLLIFASNLYLAVNVPVLSGEFLEIIDYFMATFIQFFMYCWFGNELTLAANTINTAIYKGNWYGSSLRFKKCLLINLCRMQRPVYLTIGKFSPLALGTLVAVWKAAFSYFTVINQKHGQ